MSATARFTLRTGSDAVQQASTAGRRCPLVPTTARHRTHCVCWSQSHYMYAVLVPLRHIHPPCYKRTNEPVNLLIITLREAGRLRPALGFRTTEKSWNFASIFRLSTCRVPIHSIYSSVSLQSTFDCHLFRFERPASCLGQATLGVLRPRT